MGDVGLRGLFLGNPRSYPLLLNSIITELLIMINEVQGFEDFNKGQVWFDHYDGA